MQPVYCKQWISVVYLNILQRKFFYRNVHFFVKSVQPGGGFRPVFIWASGKKNTGIFSCLVLI